MRKRRRADYMGCSLSSHYGKLRLEERLAAALADGEAEMVSRIREELAAAEGDD